ncbi:MAG TPA: hypothetical protein VFY68_00205 [Nitrososphaeraceae archaeon]|nr:hypothetical protein [Nitrososphaeraceae archaeon]
MKTYRPEASIGYLILKKKQLNIVLKHKDDNLGNIRGIDWDIEEWNVE